MSGDQREELEQGRREERIEEAQDRVAAGAGGHLAYYEDPELPSEVRERFWTGVADFEDYPDVTHHEQLVRDGLELPEPEELDDTQVHAKLWEVIRALAARDVYLYHTDHLSDRALYAHLVQEAFLELTKDFPPGSGWRTHLDIIGGYGPEELDLYDRYYASEEERAAAQRDWPERPLPPREDPPYDRDRHLPKAP